MKLKLTIYQKVAVSCKVQTADTPHIYRYTNTLYQHRRILLGSRNIINLVQQLTVN